MKIPKRKKPGAEKTAVTLTAVQWAAVCFALDRVIDKGGGPLALLWLTGPYKKLHRGLVRSRTNISNQLRKAGYK